MNVKAPLQQKCIQRPRGYTSRALSIFHNVCCKMISIIILCILLKAVYDLHLKVKQLNRIFV